jgi:tripartite-type tricarboxylate transporter receptor subunit TctC
MFKLQAKVDALHVPYKGSGRCSDRPDRRPDPVLLRDHDRGDAARSPTARWSAIAQTRTTRAKGHPTVPTMQEQGFEGFEATTWYGLVGPGKCRPGDRRQGERRRQHRAGDARRAGKARHLRRRGRRRLGRQVRRFIRTEIAKWAKVVKDADVKVDS